MPEAPELYLSAQFVTEVGARHVFGGCVEERPINASRPRKLDALNARLEGEYRVSACSRGKELRVTVSWSSAADDSPCCAHIRIGFGMTGCFQWTRSDQQHKHTRISFNTADQPPMSLAFVDTRGFATWQLSDATWSAARGPCIISEYALFRRHVLTSLHASLFSRPICEAMLDQAYFNGVGNYLRAEVLHRCGVRPFDEARAVLSQIDDCGAAAAILDDDGGCKSDKISDVLQACHVLALQVIRLGGGRRYSVPLQTLALGTVKQEPEEANKVDNKHEQDPFETWIRCYNQPDMNNMVDRQGRTIWFSGHPGTLAPKNAKSRHKKTIKTKPVATAANSEQYCVVSAGKSVISVKPEWTGQNDDECQSNNIKPVKSHDRSAAAIKTSGKRNHIESSRARIAAVPVRRSARLARAKC